MPRFAVDRLTGYAMAALRPFGVDGGAARIVADSLVDADLDGHATHGIAHLPALVDALRAGRIDPGARLAATGDASAVAVLDAGAAFGQLACARGAELAMERARLAGAGVAAVRCRNQPGTAGHALRRIAARGQIGLAFTSEAGGTGLIGAALPVGDRPVLLDVAVSRPGGGRVLQADQGLAASATSPEGHGGVATAAPRAASCEGVERAATLALLVGAIAGADPAAEETGRVFMAIDASALPGFGARVRRALGEPGERDGRERKRARRLAEGVDVPEDVVAALLAATGAPL